jgi:hypothetical protein
MSLNCCKWSVCLCFGVQLHLWRHLAYCLPRTGAMHIIPSSIGVFAWVGLPAPPFPILYSLEVLNISRFDDLKICRTPINRAISNLLLLM